MDCPLQRSGDVWRCPVCGWSCKATSDRPPHRNCPAPSSPLSTPHALRPTPDVSAAATRLGISLTDVGHYAVALTRWTAAGFPTRTPAEVARIEAEHCRPCTPHYRDGRCTKCGCRVNTSSLAVANKIAMATEHCPAGKW
jgi:hypothetical protein